MPPPCARCARCALARCTSRWATAPLMGTMSGLRLLCRGPRLRMLGVDAAAVGVSFCAAPSVDGLWAVLRRPLVHRSRCGVCVLRCGGAINLEEHGEHGDGRAGLAGASWAAAGGVRLAAPSHIAGDGALQSPPTSAASFVGPIPLPCCCPKGSRPAKGTACAAQ